MMKIAAIGGSLGSQSYTHEVLVRAMQKIASQGVATEMIDLRTLQLPFCDGGFDYPDHPDVEKLRRSIYSASGLLLATPEYHGSISGVLKNALDLLEDEHMAGKVVGLIAIVGGVHSTNALNTMRVICRQLHCWVLPDQVIIPHAEKNFDPQGNLIDPELDHRIERLTDHLVVATRKLSHNP